MGSKCENRTVEEVKERHRPPNAEEDETEEEGFGVLLQSERNKIELIS